MKVLYCTQFGGLGLIPGTSLWVPTCPYVVDKPALKHTNSRAIIAPCKDARIPNRAAYPKIARNPVPIPLKPLRPASIRAPKPFQSDAGCPTPQIRKGAEWNSLKRFFALWAPRQLGPRLLRNRPAGGTNRPGARAQTHARR